MPGSTTDMSLVMATSLQSRCLNQAMILRFGQLTDPQILSVLNGIGGSLATDVVVPAATRGSHCRYHTKRLRLGLLDPDL